MFDIMFKRNKFNQNDILKSRDLQVEMDEASDLLGINDKFLLSNHQAKSYKQYPAAKLGMDLRLKHEVVSRCIQKEKTIELSH